MAFRRPSLPPGPVKDLNDALHSLHLRSGEPSASSIADGLALSRNTVHLLFTKGQVPRWGPFELVVEKLCELASDDPKRYRELWIAARQAEMGRADLLLVQAPPRPGEPDVQAPVRPAPDTSAPEPHRERRRQAVEEPGDGGREIVLQAEARGWVGEPSLSQIRIYLPYDRLVDIPGVPGIPIGVRESDLRPVAVDPDEDPHFVVFGDVESGKSSFLRVFAESVTRLYHPSQARMIVIDHRRSLLGSIQSDHLIGYGTSAQVTSDLLTQVVGAMRERAPGPDVTPEQLRKRSWWRGPDLFLLVDDYDSVATSGADALASLQEFLEPARDIGLHLVLTCRTGGAGRAMFGPVLSRLRERSTPALILSGREEEALTWGDAKSSVMPPGRGWLVHRRNRPELIQLAYLPPS